MTKLIVPPRSLPERYRGSHTTAEWIELLSEVFGDAEPGYPSSLDRGVKVGYRVLETPVEFKIAIDAGLRNLPREAFSGIPTSVGVFATFPTPFGEEKVPLSRDYIKDRRAKRGFREKGEHHLVMLKVFPPQKKYTGWTGYKTQEWQPTLAVSFGAHHYSTFRRNPNSHIVEARWGEAETWIDAADILAIRVVRPEILEAIHRRLDSLEVTETVRGGFGGNATYDKDAEFGEAVSRAVLDLCVPPKSLHRPFLDDPLFVPHLQRYIEKGTRVQILDGQVVRLTGLYVDWSAPDRQKTYLVKDDTTWLSNVGSSTLYRQGIFEPTIVRVLSLGERIPMTERVRVWRENREKIARLLREHAPPHAQPGFNDVIHQELLAHDLRACTSDTPPWMRTR